MAIDIDEAARHACAAVAERIRAKNFDARWVPPSNYHLTVAFIGSVEIEQIEAVIDALHDVAPRIPAPQIPLDTVGAFPQPKRPRVVWVGPRNPVPAFGTASGAVRAALVALGFSFDPHNDAHVTIARAEGRAPLPSVAPPRDVVVRGDTLTLYRSIAAPEGAQYEPLHRERLRDR